MTQSVDDLLAQLRPVTGPEAAPPATGDEWWWFWPVLLIVVVNAFCIWVLRRRRSRPAIAPDAEALAALNRLPAAPSSAALADLDQTARRYLERVHYVAAGQMTSAELLAVLPDTASSEWSAIFAQLQPGRFSKRAITTEEWTTLIQQVRPLIRVVHADLAGPVVQ